MPQKPKAAPSITDEIKEEDDEQKEGSDDSEDDSPPANSVLDSDFDKTVAEEGGEQEDKDEFPSLEEALAEDFDINKVSKLQQRLKDVNQQPRARNALFPFRLQLLSKRVKKCKSCKKKIVGPND